MKQIQYLSPFLKSRAYLLQETNAVALLQDSSREAQSLRRALLRSARILIVGGGPQSKLRFYHHLASMDVHLYLMDSENGPWSKTVYGADSPFRGFLSVNLSNLEILPQQARAAAEATDKTPKEFDAVFTFFELYVEHAALVNEVLSPSRDYTSFAQSARNKASTRNTLSANQISSPRYYKISTTADVLTACSHVGFPAVLKPISGVFSNGVINVNSAEDVFCSVNKAFERKNLEFEKTQKSEHRNQNFQSFGGEMILEEFLDGPEFDVDLLFSNGKAVYGRVTDNWGFEPPWCQDCGLQGPSRFPPRQQQELIDMAVQCAKAVGAIDGAVHAELRYTREGPRLIEINARMGGAAIFDVHQRIWDVDLVENHCMAMCGIPICPVACEKPLCHFTCIILYAPYSGQVTSNDWLDFLRHEDGVLDVVYEKEKGALVNGPEHASPDWIGQVYIAGNSREEVDTLVKGIVTERAPVPIASSEAGRERRYFFPGHMFPFSSA